MWKKQCNHSTRKVTCTQMTFRESKEVPEKKQRHLVQELRNKSTKKEKKGTGDRQKK